VTNSEELMVLVLSLVNTLFELNLTAYKSKIFACIVLMSIVFLEMQ